MEMKDLEVNQRLEATVLRRGVRENLRLDGALEAYAELEINVKHLDGDTLKTQWSGLLLTRDGGRNSGTFRSLETLGCDGDVVKWLNADFKPMKIDVVIGQRPNNKDPFNPYKYVQWLNKHRDAAPNHNIIGRLEQAGLGKVVAEKPVAKADDNPEMPF